MNIGVGSDAGEQRFVPAFQQFVQKSFPVAEVIDKAPRIGAGAQGQAADGESAEPGFPDDHGSRIEQVLSGGFRLGMTVKLKHPCVLLIGPEGKDLLRLSL